MFFLIRSAFCIGIVALMLPGDHGSSTVRDLAAETRTAASGGLHRYCAATETCATVGAGLAAWLMGDKTAQPGSAHRGATSVSTLQAADLVPSWTGPKAPPRG